MNRNKLKTFNHYFKRFLTWSFTLAGAFYFIFTVVAMTTMPTIKSSDISHASHISTLKIAEAIQVSLRFWQFMFWLPIIGGLAFTVIEGIMSYSKRRHQLKRKNDPRRKKI
ncbi:hypothetical protein FGL72_03665 [Leuconostoc citreum]|uniref:hypothetical protein n=1 Tax=Leuconostoc citreum TaxID=33964 RepID=UPI0011BB628B|nr:hypothetical protein [Leuconostoc citreum]QEA46263.1 hypothetical protein FGL82_07730 [Leuconostoc citreum]QEA62953.1 hypothetical protein FGL72_03665 [Leuconostoc citreum]